MPSDEVTQTGPMSSELAAATMDRHLSDAAERRAERFTGGGMR